MLNVEPLRHLFQIPSKHTRLHHQKPIWASVVTVIFIFTNHGKNKRKSVPKYSGGHWGAFTNTEPRPDLSSESIQEVRYNSFIKLLKTSPGPPVSVLKRQSFTYQPIEHLHSISWETSLKQAYKIMTWGLFCFKYLYLSIFGHPHPKYTPISVLIGCALRLFSPACFLKMDDWLGSVLCCFKIWLNEMVSTVLMFSPEFANFNMNSFLFNFFLLVTHTDLLTWATLIRSRKDNQIMSRIQIL